ncbi:hypothetical protein KEJ17_03580, partial [Candidatus Bathyarchaeota archaeon]|nr:hypothetical protein [Candidatus Bathyarchaeota archaeon]
YVVLSYLPGFPVIGISGAKIGIISGIAPIYGFILGPMLGTLTTFLGAFINRVLTGASLFEWLTLPSMPLSAFTAGALSRSRLNGIAGWKISAVILTVLIAAWYLTYVGQAVPLFAILHWFGLMIILVLRSKLAEFFYSNVRKKLSLSILLCSYSATITSHMYGCLVFILAANLLLINMSDLSSLFIMLIPIATFERLMFTLMSTVIGVPLCSLLRNNIASNIE